MTMMAEVMVGLKKVVAFCNEAFKDGASSTEPPIDIFRARPTLKIPRLGLRKWSPQLKTMVTFRSFLTSSDQAIASFRLSDIQLAHKAHFCLVVAALGEIEIATKILKDDAELGFSSVKNRMLLWHGSRPTNWTGILSQGLRIAPPEAPSTGYMFRKGVYLTDMFSKSANYCYAIKESADWCAAFL